MKLKPYIVAVFSLMVVSTANAAPWKKVGYGEMHVMFWHAYDSTLYTRGGAYDAKKPFALKNTYRMDFSQEDLIERTFSEMKRHGKFSAQDQERWAGELKKLWPDMKENESIRADVLPGKRVTFYVNGKKTGSINDAKFAELFPQIWLGEKTSEPALRKKLLSLN